MTFPSFRMNKDLQLDIFYGGFLLLNVGYLYAAVRHNDWGWGIAHAFAVAACVFGLALQAVVRSIKREQGDDE